VSDRLQQPRSIPVCSGIACRGNAPFTQHHGLLERVPNKAASVVAVFETLHLTDLAHAWHDKIDGLATPTLPAKLAHRG
jgi:hypothetical protein